MTQLDALPETVVLKRRVVAGGVERLPSWRGRDMDAHPWPVTMELTVCRWCEREVPTCCIADDIVPGVLGVCGRCVQEALKELELRAIAAAIAEAHTRPPHPRREKIVWKAQRERVKERARELADEKRQERKLKNAAKAIARQQDRDGLFSQTKTYQTPTERDEMFAKSKAMADQEWRDAEARQWREARQILRDMPIEQRATLVYKWNASRVPATATYFLSYLRTALRQTSAVA